MNLRDKITLSIRYFVYKWLYKLRRNIAVSHDDVFFAIYREVTESRRLTMNFTELYNVYRLVPKVVDVEGDIAEVGVFKGASAKVLCERRPDKEVHLFDTFEGLPDIDAQKDKTEAATAFSKSGEEALAMEKGMFSATYDDVTKFLSGYEGVHFWRGLFPETAEPVKDRKFAFVHLDVDIYSSTLDGLKFFYPRMPKGAMLLSHDYGTISCPGVKQAFDEFMADKPEHLIELWDTQILFIKQ